MNETKVNTNIGDVSSPESKKATLTQDDARAHFEASAAVSMTNGTFLVEQGGAYDHATMRAGQLSSLLLLMRLEDARNFRNISDDCQLNLMWLASQLADELKEMLPIVEDEVRTEGQA